MPGDKILLQDLISDNHEYEYHQDFVNKDFLWPKFWSIVISCAALALGILYTTVRFLNAPLLSPTELIWNCLVYIAPVRLLEYFEKRQTSENSANLALTSLPRTHAAKVQALRRLLGFDTPVGVLGTVAQAGRRRLSNLQGTRMALQGGDDRPAGLGNWDNSCYQNSVLQGLASLDSFSDYLAYPCGSLLPEDAAATDMKMANTLRNLIAELKDPSNNGKRLWTPATLKSMSSWQQQDAQEYFSKVLDEIDKEVSRAAAAAAARKPLKGLEKDYEAPPQARSLRFELEKQAASLTSIRNPLEGLLAQRVGCTRCGYSEGLSLIPFNCLTLPLGNAHSYDLSQCLDEYTKLEYIEGVECGKCTLLKTQKLLNIILERIKESDGDNKVKASTLARLETVNEALEDDDYEDKTLTQKCKIPSKNRTTTTKSRQAAIARPPKSLAVHINRSLFDEMTGELKKNYAEVSFPRRLDLGPWCLGSSGTSNETHYEEWLLDPGESMISSSRGPTRIQGPFYELRAVVTHYGRHENGHYICYKKHPIAHDTINEKNTLENQWWRLSDDDVTKVSEGTVSAQGGVFMLFYDCVEPASVRPSQLPKLEAEVNVAPATVKEAEVVVAPLLADVSDVPSISDDGASSVRTSREQSITTSVSEVEDSEEREYKPTKPILIPPFMQSSREAHKDANEERNLTGRIVMV